MATFVKDNILPLPEELADNITFERQKRSIRIAVLDTGFHADERDELLKCGQERIILRRNFVGEDEHAYVDSYGHGTHVARLLLRFTPFAKIIIAKISESKKLTGGSQVVKALDWVGGPDCNADIIVMSFGLGQTPNPQLQSLIKFLVEKGKLIFAAASNGGGNEPRAFPANEAGVFCMHVSDGKGNKVGINPAPVGIDNFSTLGNAIDSRWDGEDIYINGSSFAVPIAAAIAANALEFIRHALTDQEDRPGYFYHYQGMRALFHCLSDGMDGYDYVKPWKRYLWDEETHPEDTCSALRAIVTYGHERWIKMTSEDSFRGFG
ncbi:peptidase S8/S53 domain-containing protein [Xylariaceae sp. FL0255]|nr:peptidase S8/S53 domain-containing protein [Xylariaceae sp. FL0255]